MSITFKVGALRSKVLSSQKKKQIVKNFRRLKAEKLASDAFIKSNDVNFRQLKEKNVKAMKNCDLAAEQYGKNSAQHLEAAYNFSKVWLEYTTKKHR